MSQDNTQPQDEHPATTHIQGILIVTIVGVLSWLLGDYFPRLGGVTIAIILGVLVGNLLAVMPQWETATAVGAKIGEKRLLPIAIVLLGVELQLLALVDLGLLALAVISVSIATSLFISVQIGSMLGYSEKFSLLMGAGNGICGSSAVAATSMSIDADEADTGISISVVNLLGTIGIFLMPAIIRLFSLDDVQGGMLIGGTLQAFGQVVAAGFSVNDDVGNVATVVKMGRILMLGPMVILIGTWLQSKLKHKRDGDSATQSNVQIPRFIIGFFVISILASLNVFPPDVLAWLKTAGKFLLVVAMAGIGMRIQLQTLFKSGAGALLFGALISTLQIIMTLIVILLLT
ncbi:MAG: putative sulfate exporter family transporter [Chloroflexota bacterium]